MVGYNMAEIQFTPNSKWPYPVYQLADESSLQLLGDQSSSITELSRSTDQPSSPVAKKLKLQSDKGFDSDSEEDLRRTPSPPAGEEVSGSDLVQSPPADGLSRPKCASSPVLTKPEDPNQKPALSYIALISMAILSHPEKKMLLGEIYQYIMDNYPFYKKTDDRAWRNSIRHNLSLNECFIKNGRADNGKGNFWSIHLACEEDFAKGDYRRRHARRRARRSTQPLVTGLPQQYRYDGYVPMKPMTTNFGLTYGSTYGRYMPYSYGSYPTAYPTAGFGGYAPNVTVSTPGSGYVHQQHMNLMSSPLSSVDSSLNSSIGSSPSQGSISSSPSGLSLSPANSSYMPTGYGSTTAFATPSSTSPTFQPTFPSDTYSSAAAAAAASTFMHTSPLIPTQGNGQYPSLSHFNMKEISLKDALAGLSALAN